MKSGFSVERAFFHSPLQCFKFSVINYRHDSHPKVVVHGFDDPSADNHENDVKYASLHDFGVYLAQKLQLDDGTISHGFVVRARLQVFLYEMLTNFDVQ